jgi:hypothetical protein
MRSILLFLAAFLVLVVSADSQTPPSEKPKRIHAPHPIFPDGAENFIYGESITVWIDVDKKGRVIDARTYGPLAPCSNLGDPVAAAIRRAAVAAARANVFEPIQRKGKPIEATLPITYALRPEVSSGKPETKLDKGSVLNGKARKLPRPEYPSDASRSRASGEVSIQVFIGETGEVLSAAAVSGHPLLIDVSVEAACKARFTPTLLRGEPVKVTGKINYNFDLWKKPLPR